MGNLKRIEIKSHKQSLGGKFYQWILLISIMLFTLISVISVWTTYTLNRNAYSDSLTMQGNSQMEQIDNILHNFGMQTACLRNTPSVIHLLSDTVSEENARLDLEKQVGDDIQNSIGQLDFFLGAALSDTAGNYYLKNTSLTDYSTFVSQSITPQSLNFNEEKYALNFCENEGKGILVYTSPVLEEGTVIGYFHLLLSNRILSLPVTQPHQQILLINEENQHVFACSSNRDLSQGQAYLSHTDGLLTQLNTPDPLIRYHDGDGKEMLAVINKTEKSPLCLVTAVTTENVTKAILPYTYFQVLISLLLMLITAMLVFVLFRRITQPVSDLIEQCSQAANGNDSIEIESNADTVLDKLASAFNSYRKKLEAAAYSDFLLEIGTRQKYLRDVDYLIAEGNVAQFSLFLVDIIEFGKYNDVFSTEVGDALLQQVSERLEALFGTNLYRINGDVFLVIMQNCDDQLMVGEHIHQLIKNSISLGSKRFELRCKVAICSFPDHGTSARTLLEKAQSTMHLMKLSTYEDTVIYNSSILNTLHQEEEILALLKRRIADQTLEVWYQPIYHQQDGIYRSAEALLRLRNDSGGFVSPFEAVTIAEKNNMIDLVGDYVLEKTCLFIKQLQTLDIDIGYIQVNLSVQQLSQNDYAEHAFDIISKTGISPQKLGMEITETMMIQSTSGTNNTLEKLRQEGIRIAMDDFGSGYCGINYLSKLPLDILKVDREVVLMVEENEEQFAFVKTIFELAKIKKILSVAEGIETVEMLDKITACGADCIQGYYFSKPLCPDDFIKFMKVQEGIALKKS